MSTAPALGLVAQWKHDGFLGDDVVAEGGQDHPEVPPSEVDSDGDSAVAVQADVQCAAAGAGDGFCRCKAGVQHDFDDV